MTALRAVSAVRAVSAEVPPMGPWELLEVYGRQVEDLTAVAVRVHAGAGVLVAALRELRTVHHELTAALATAAAPVRECIGCGEDFRWDSSPDPDRCARCAQAHAWREGCTDTTDTRALRRAAGRDLREAW